MKAKLPHDEAARIAALHQYQILDTPPELAFDDLTALAAAICQTPTALVSLVDSNRQWFKSRVGLSATETHRDLAFCAHCILSDELLVVPDASRDPRFANNPLVTGEPRIRFYAGAPLINDQGYALGSLCVIDYVPRELSKDQQASLSALGRQVVAQLELRRILKNQQAKLNLQQAIHTAEVQASLDAIITIDHQGKITDYNPAAERLFQYQRDEALGQTLAELIIPPALRKRHQYGLQHYLNTGESHILGRRLKLTALRKDGTEFPAEVAIAAMHLEDGSPIFTGYLRDISEQQAQDEKIQRLSRVYAVLSRVNSAIIRIHDRDALFQEACRIAIEHSGFGMAWIALQEPGSDIIKPVSWSGFEPTKEMLKSMTHAINHVEGSGTTSDCIRSRKTVYCNDITVAPNINATRQVAIEHGCLSVISLPLFADEYCIGALVLHAQAKDFFDENEIKLLDELAANISFGLDYIEKEQRVDYLAYHDPLTGLANRHMVRVHLDNAINDARLRNRSLAFLLININNFREVNNTLGHASGDALLKEIASRLQRTMHGYDAVARLGDDHFAILLTGLVSETQIDRVVTKIQQILNKTFTINDIPLNVDFAIGAAFYPAHGDDTDELWQHAEVALQTARQQHQLYVLYDNGIDHHDPEQLALLGNLRSAINNGQLVLHYQPIIDTRKNKITGIEALVRWQHPVQGLVYPDQFIPYAERTEIINPLTNWVLENALQQAWHWTGKGICLDMSINLSARNLQNPNLRNEIKKLLLDRGLPPEKLTLEITESTIMVNPQRAYQVLHELHDAGMHISIDDFGTGYSSLAYLKNLPVSKMKIDKSFILNMQDPKNRMIVATAIELGHNLHLEVTAEGVEHSETMLLLQKMGCDKIQGYFLTRPLAADDFIKWLKKTTWH